MQRLPPALSARCDPERTDAPPILFEGPPGGAWDMAIVEQVARDMALERTGRQPLCFDVLSLWQVALDEGSYLAVVASEGRPDRFALVFPYTSGPADAISDGDDGTAAVDATFR